MGLRPTCALSMSSHAFRASGREPTARAARIASLILNME